MNFCQYKGPTLLEALGMITESKRKSDKPLQISILDVYKIGGIGTVFVGRIETGVLKRDMAASFALLA